MTDAVYADIAEGRLVCIAAASSLTGIGYWTLRRRLRREHVPTLRLHGRCYVSVQSLQNPALRVP